MYERKKLLLRKDDLVQVIAGKDKGKQGKVLKTYPKQDRILVEGVGSVKRHTKASQQHPQGGIVSKDSPIHVSNVMFVDPTTGKPTRLGKKKVDGKTAGKSKFVRFAKGSGTLLDGAK